MLRNYHHPSIVFFKGKWIGAVRGSNLGQCQGFGGLMKSTLQFIRQSHWNEIVIGEITSSFGYSSEGYFDLNPQLRLPNIRDQKVQQELPSFQGHLDPRLILFGDDLYMITSREINGRMKLFLTQLRVNSEYTKELQFDELRSEDIVQINFTDNPNEELMNWMYIPNDRLRYIAPRYNEQFHKEFMSDDGMFFVSQLEPLIIVKVFPQNGTAVTVFKSRSQNSLTSEYQSLRGSTNLVFNEEMNAFIGIAHERQIVAQATIVPLRVHHNRLFSLEFIENEWKVTWISNPFGMGSRFSLKKASERITSPVSFVDYKDSYIISFGEMECTSHVSTISKRDFVGKVRNI
ncbi:hypothetical protein MP638_002556 [Amoeboaphelidium occidentale]|nr:hypothetical protein MP638_002556 [Amoeboaphelidium occidentale]